MSDNAVSEPTPRPDEFVENPWRNECSVCGAVDGGWCTADGGERLTGIHRARLGAAPEPLTPPREGWFVERAIQFPAGVYDELLDAADAGNCTVADIVIARVSDDRAAALEGACPNCKRVRVPAAESTPKEPHG